MVDPGSLLAAADGVKFVASSLKALLGAKLDSDAMQRVHDSWARVIDVQEKLLTAQQYMMEQNKEIEALRSEISRLSHKESLQKSYSLFQTVGGAKVYRSTEGGEHFACPACYAKGIIGILQGRGLSGWMSVCPICNAGFETGHEPPVPRQEPRGYPWDE